MQTKSVPLSCAEISCDEEDRNLIQNTMQPCLNSAEVRVCVSIYMYDCVLAVPEVVHTLSNSKHRTNYTPGRGKIVPRK